MEMQVENHPIQQYSRQNIIRWAVPWFNGCSVGAARRFRATGSTLHPINAPPSFSLFVLNQPGNPSKNAPRMKWTLFALLVFGPGLWRRLNLKSARNLA
jgi:hypothetical protein